MSFIFDIIEEVGIIKLTYRPRVGIVTEKFNVAILFSFDELIDVLY